VKEEKKWKKVVQPFLYPIQLPPILEVRIIFHSISFFLGFSLANPPWQRPQAPSPPLADCCRVKWGRVHETFTSGFLPWLASHFISLHRPGGGLCSFEGSEIGMSEAGAGLEGGFGVRTK